ncbi:hypothetical protein KR067_009447 [Drosophila pandora]|nr:hypothetical protein KR067_009447 [Drosophila pandora]
MSLENNLLLLLCCVSFFLAYCVLADPSFPNWEYKRKDNMETLDSMVSRSGPLHMAQPKQLKIQKKPMEGYTEFDPFFEHRRRSDSYNSNNDFRLILEPRIHGEPNLETLNRPVHQLWRGEFYASPLAKASLFPSRSYDPYIRRYDRFDEQYHRTHPQYLEDMYMHRQRFDPHDSYSPRVPQYPDPYVMYPDRYMDTPTVSIKSGRGYSDDIVPLSDFYGNSKYDSKKLPEVVHSSRNERIVYYAHLPEIVRTPYESARQEERTSAALIASSNIYNKKIKNNPRPSAGNETSYEITL